MVFPYFFDRPAQLFIFVRDRDDAQNLREPGIGSRTVEQPAECRLSFWIATIGFGVTAAKPRPSTSAPTEGSLVFQRDDEFLALATVAANLNFAEVSAGAPLI